MLPLLLLRRPSWYCRQVPALYCTLIHLHPPISSARCLHPPRLPSSQAFDPDARYIGLPCDYGNGFGCTIAGMIFSIFASVAREWARPVMVSATREVRVLALLCPCSQSRVFACLTVHTGLLLRTHVHACGGLSMRHA